MRIYGRPFRITRVRFNDQTESNVVEGYFTDDKDDLTKYPGAYILVAYPESVLELSAPILDEVKS